MTSDAYRRTPIGAMGDIHTRLDLLERRLARATPARLSTAGQEVTDWHDVTAAGFYWGRDAANAPDGGLVTAVAKRANSRLVLEASKADVTPSSRIRTWRDLWVSGAGWQGWVELNPDTGWVTSGLGITTSSEFNLSSYKLRKVGSRMSGDVYVTYVGANVTTGADGNMTDKSAAIVMPAGWRNASPIELGIVVMRSGLRAWFGRVRANSSWIDLTHGIPNVTLSTNDTLHFNLDYYVD